MTVTTRLSFYAPSHRFALRLRRLASSVSVCGMLIWLMVAPVEARMKFLRLIMLHSAATSAFAAIGGLFYLYIFTNELENVFDFFK